MKIHNAALEKAKKYSEYLYSFNTFITYSRVEFDP